MLIGVAGMVGSGKSTLTRALAARFGLQLALESVDDAAPPVEETVSMPSARARAAGVPAVRPAPVGNPWLELFYGEPGGRERYGLNLQLHFLATRFASMRQMRGLGGSWVLDRTWYEDADVFARGLFEQGLLTPAEYQLYERLYAELLHSPAARPPALLVYLHAPLEVIVKRIERRGRQSERETEHAYWAALHARYARWISAFRACPVLKLDVRDYDLVEDPSAIEDVAARVRERLERRLPQTELWPAVPRSALTVEAQASRQ